MLAAALGVVVPGFAARVPFAQGAREIVAWYDEDADRQRSDARLDAVMDTLVDTYRPILKQLSA